MVLTISLASTRVCISELLVFCNYSLETCEGNTKRRLSIVLLDFYAPLSKGNTEVFRTNCCEFHRAVHPNSVNLHTPLFSDSQTIIRRCVADYLSTVLQIERMQDAIFEHGPFHTSRQDADFMYEGKPKRTAKQLSPRT